MNILLLGAAGFIGTNLALKLLEDPRNQLTLADTNRDYFLPAVLRPGVTVLESPMDENTDFSPLVKGQDVVYHLVSTTVPTTSNRQVAQELRANVVMTSQLLEACVEQGVKRVIFLSSGGTVYGKAVACPLAEDTPTDPISSYGVQKITIEKLLHLYYCMHG